ncbi:MAG TPA: hemin uptake protein HemP [Rhizobacter sp.]|nr:hemin uptake protein HemP [Rhizobacter sp.]
MATQPLPPATPAPATPQPAARDEVQRISSETLLGGAQEVQIEHRGALYRLRQTSLGKLILTK